MIENQTLLPTSQRPDAAHEHTHEGSVATHYGVEQENTIESPHILLVEDDDDLSRLYSNVLRGAGYRVSVAATAADATEVLKQKPVLLVVTDWYLPDGTGASVCEQAREQNPLIPVLLISGQADSRTLLVSNTHVNAWLSKPVMPHSLLSTVEQLLNNSAQP